MNKQKGFTLIEVLVSTIVLAFGLLGLAALQANNLKNNQSAYLRSQATQLAYDIADRMRANATSVENYLSATIAVADASKQDDCLSASKGCTPAEMAENDLYEWHEALTNIFPGGQAMITQTGDIYTITIYWDDNHDGEINGTDPNFQMGFQL